MKLSEYMKTEGVTATAFAAKIGRSVATISRLARGLRAPDWPTMRAIAEATGGAVQPNDFYDEPPRSGAPAPSPDAAPAAPAPTAAA